MGVVCWLRANTEERSISERIHKKKETLIGLIEKVVTNNHNNKLR